METDRDKIKENISKLYEFYPELKEYEEKLINLVAKMIEAKPDVSFDQNFATSLKNKIFNEIKNNNKQEKNTFNLNLMNKKFYIAAGSLLALCLLFIAFISMSGPRNEKTSNWSISSLIGTQNKAEEVKRLPAGSFGNLVALSSDAGEMQELATLSANGLGSATMEMDTARDGEAREEVINPAPLGMTGEVLGMGGGVASSKMILPYYGFKYVYKGEEINLENESSLVYRRIKDQASLSQDLARTMSSFNFPNVDMNKFSDLKVQNISFVEDKDFGLMINFDLREGVASIYENWDKWMNERESCGSDQACWDRFRIKIEDVPQDNVLISLSNEFLSQHNIDLSNYGDPQVDNNWRQYYAMAENKADYYIPESMSVIYPLLIDGSMVRDQAGNYSGLRVTINVLHDRVSGVSGIMPYRYESSQYDLEQDESKVIDLAEMGGWSRNYYPEGAEDLLEVELSTPEFAYVQLWRYNGSYGEELLVPALIFPVSKRPDNGYYYGNNYVVVPLVNELIAELEKDRDNWPRPMPLLRDDVIEPMPVESDGGIGGTTSNVQNEDGTSVDSEMEVNMTR